MVGRADAGVAVGGRASVGATEAEGGREASGGEAVPGREGSIKAAEGRTKEATEALGGLGGEVVIATAMDALGGRGGEAPGPPAVEGRVGNSAEEVIVGSIEVGGRASAEATA